MYAPRRAALLAALILLVPPALAASPDATWEAEIRHEIARSEYRFSADDDGGWVAPNRANNLRVRLSEAGLVVEPRMAVSGTPAWHWRFEMTVVGFGREEAPGAVRSPLPWSDGERVEYLHDAGLTEWYRNGPGGLKQGFLIETPPAGTGRVTIDMQLAGGLVPQIADDRRSILFLAPGAGPAMRYAGLVVVDAEGRALDARLVASGSHLRILIDDEGAAYPLDVDPLVTDPSWVAEGAIQDAFMGVSVDTAGDVNNDGFDDVIVGAYQYDAPEADEGRVFVFLGSDSGPETTPQWTFESDKVNAELGWSVSTAGDVNGDGFDDVIVGAHHYKNGQDKEGRAYVFLGSANGIAGGPAWTVESNQAGAELGQSVSSAGDVNGDGFDDIIVGAHRYDGAFTNEGRAWVYHGSPSGPSTTPAWVVDGNQNFAELGYSVSGAGDVDGDGTADVIIGARVHDSRPRQGLREGAAFVYLGSTSGLSTAPTAGTSPSYSPDSLLKVAQSTAEFGYSVSDAGDVDGDGFDDVIVGARSYTGDLTKEGGAFLYRGSPAGTEDTPSWSAEGDEEFSDFGSAVAGAGDVNADGFDDVIVGARALDNPEDSEGAAYVFIGGASGLETTAAWSVEGDLVGAELGFSVAGAGDVDGDGTSDVIVGAQGFSPSSDPEDLNKGRAVVFTAFSPFFKVRSPGNGSGYFADTTTQEFRWFTGDTVEQKVEWSSKPTFGKPKKSSGKRWLGGVTEYTPGPSLWLKILKLGKNSPTVYWRVRGKTATGEKVFTEARTFDVTPVEGPDIVTPGDGAVFSPADPPPLLTWNENHNEVYKIVFSPSPSLRKPKATSGKGFPVTGSSWQVPQAVWDKIVLKLAPKAIDGQGTVYWAIYSKDALKRKSQSAVQTIRIQ